MKFLDFWDKANKWFNQNDRKHDIMRFGLGFTFVGILTTFMRASIPFLLWGIYVVAQEIRDIIKWTKLEKFKKMWKDGIYDLAWGFSGVCLYAVLNYFIFIHLLTFTVICVIICVLYSKEVRYRE